MEAALGPFLDQLADLSLPVMLVVILAELILLRARRQLKRGKEIAVSFASYMLGWLPYLLFISALQLALMMWLYEHARLLTLGNEWYVWLAAFVLFDLAWWLVHYAAHKVRLLWCIHGAHHTPKEMNMSVAIRGSLFDFFQYVHLVVWLPILGFHPYLVFIVEILSRLYGVLTHMNETGLRRTPLLDAALITPSLHRVHHAANHIYVDTNFSNLLSLWDRVFGTYQRELEVEPPAFGLSDNDRVNSESVLSTQLGLWRDLIDDICATPRWTDKLAYLVMPPGWSPDPEKSVTAKQQRDRALRELEHRTT